jgi:hypothetical protein
MMIFRKTTKGQAEIDAASRTLPQKLRMVLVLVDGKRNMHELQAMLASATPQALLDLRTLGMIEVAPQPAAPAKTKAHGEAAPSRFEPSRLPSRFQSSRLPSRFENSQGASSRFDHSRTPSRFDVAACAEDAPVTDEQREQIARSLSRALGPAADGLVHSIHQARTVRDLMDVVSTAQRAISNARGKDMADEFASRYGHIDEI